MKRKQRKNETAAEGLRLASIPETLDYLTGQGYKVSRRTLYSHRAQGILKEQAGGGYLLYVVDAYARHHLERPGIAAPGGSAGAGADHRARLVKAMAEERELKVSQLRGNLLNAAEEEARDAAVLLGIRRHMENSGAEIVKGIIADLAVVLTTEQQAAAMVRLPEWIEHYRDRLAAAFDQIAQAGGVTADGYLILPPA